MSAIEETIQSIAGLNAEHHANGTSHQRVVDRITSLLGRAGFIAVLTVLIVGWVSLNCFALALGYRAPDPAPFAWLAGASCTRCCGTEPSSHRLRRFRPISLPDRRPHPAKERRPREGADDGADCVAAANF